MRKLFVSLLNTFLLTLLTYSSFSSAENLEIVPKNKQPWIFYINRDTITYKKLAAYYAPILWFSPDEPLLQKNSLVSAQVPLIPQPLPFDEKANAPVVYFQIAEIDSKDSDELFQNPLILKKVRQIQLDYMFYYAHDYGVGSHLHDLEGASFFIEITEVNAPAEDQDDNPTYLIRLNRVEAWAHGQKWYHNTLVFRGTDTIDFHFPIVLLVEEGKHASCPDRNGDGFYTPGYDVNTFVNDAWGIRDTIRNKRLSTPYYHTWMTKRRHEQTRIYPNNGLLKHTNVPSDRLYVLKSAHEIRERIDKDTQLVNRLKDGQFGKPPRRSGASAFPLAGVLTLLYPLPHNINFFAYDRNRIGMVGEYPFPIESLNGWLNIRLGFLLAPKTYINKSEEGSFLIQMEYSPSISRFAEWYLSPVGLVMDSKKDSESFHYTSEGGISLRLNKPSLSLRLGIRNEIEPQLKFTNTRLVLELGFLRPPPISPVSSLSQSKYTTGILRMLP